MTPMPLPAEIREIQRFHPTDGLSWGFDLSRRLAPQWRAAVGLHYFDRGMRTEARVKAYEVKVVQAGNTLERLFLGHQPHTRFSTRFCLPLQAEVATSLTLDLLHRSCGGMVFRQKFYWFGDRWLHPCRSAHWSQGGIWLFPRRSAHLRL